MRRRIVEQFSGAGTRADVWRGFELFLDTDEFLNLGYSARYQPHALGSSQLRLARKIGAGLAARLDRTAGAPLLDVGCGRGGPSIHLAEAHGFDVTGVDLVPYNVELARENATERSADAAFVVGDAMHLPFAPGSFPACTAIDSPVYFDDRRRFFAELSTVLSPGGIAGVSDLVVDDAPGPEERDRVDAFAAAWDFAPLDPLERYVDGVEAAGLEVIGIEDISPNSIDRFGTWARLFLAARRTFLGRPMDRFFARRGVDLDVVSEQIEAARAALPFLGHVIVYARR